MSRYRINEPTALYRYFDPKDDLLYVGVSLNVASRMSQHAETPWGFAVANVAVQWFDCGVDALSAERRAIKSERPKYNVRSSIKPGRASQEGRWHSIERHCLNYVKSYLWSDAMTNGCKVEISTEYLCSLTSMSQYEVEACLGWLETREKVHRIKDVGQSQSVHVLDIFFDVFKELPGAWRLDVWTPQEAFE